MAHLLDLVDRLIGSVLAGNLYTSDSTYVGVLDGSSNLQQKSISTNINRPQLYEGDWTPGPVPPSVPQQTIDQQNKNYQSVNRNDAYQERPPVPGPVPPSVEQQSSDQQNKDYHTTNRNTLYQERPDVPGPVPPSVRQQAANVSSDSPPPPRDSVGTNIDRQKIYNESDSLNRGSNIPPEVQELVEFHQQNVGGFTKGKSQTDVSNPLFEKGESFSRRNEIYESLPDINSNIGGTPISKETAGDQLAKQNQAPPSLNFDKGDNVPTGLRPEQGKIADNLYDHTSVPFKGKFAPLSQHPVPPPLRYGDIFAVSHWLRGVGREMGTDIPLPLDIPGAGEINVENIAKGQYFIATQFLMASLNPGNPENGGPLNQIWNPLSLGAALPFVSTAVGATNITLGAAASDYKTNTQQLGATGGDRLLLARQGAYIEQSAPHRLTKLQSPIPAPGYIGDTTKVGDSSTLDNPGLTALSTIDAQTGGPGEELVQSQGIHTNTYTSERPYIDNAVLPLKELEETAKQAPSTSPGDLKLKELFFKKPFPGAGRHGDKAGVATWVAVPSKLQTRGFDNASKADAPGINPATTDVALNGEDVDLGTLEKVIPDDAIYMPFMFQDLRDNPPKFLYFRAFLKEGMSETFTPDWQVERYYGRVDQVPIYMGTVRSVNLSFDIVAWSPHDLPVMYRKLEKVQSMVYPTYDFRGFMKQGPICKIRIGDYLSGKGKKGLPGYITSMDFSFPDGIWNIEQDFKVPRLITVSIAFTVLHDGNPGIYHAPEYSYNIENGRTNKSLPLEGGIGNGKHFGAGMLQSGDSEVKLTTNSVRNIFDVVRNK